MSSCSRASYALAGALLVLIAGGLVPASPAGADPTPPPPAVDVLPGLLPPVTPPAVVPSLPIVGGVVSTVNGVGTTVQQTVAGVLGTGRPAATRQPSVGATTHPTTPGDTSGARPRTTHRTVARPAAPTRVTHRAATRRATAPRTVALGGRGAARTGVLVAPPAVSRPATIVEQAADAVIHPGRVLLSLIAVTAVCALGLLALVGSLGRRTW